MRIRTRDRNVECASRRVDAPVAFVQFEDVFAAGVQVQAGDQLLAAVPVHGPGVPAAGGGNGDRLGLADADGAAGEVRTPQCFALGRVRVNLVLAVGFDALGLRQVEGVDGNAVRFFTEKSTLPWPVADRTVTSRVAGPPHAAASRPTSTKRRPSMRLMLRE